MTYLAYLREKKLNAPVQTAVQTAKFTKETLFGADSVSAGKRKKAENPPSLPLLKTIASLWKSGKANNEHFNKKFCHEEITLFSYQA